jgi:hypothetical protein
VNISKKDFNLILALLGVIILVVSYFVVFRNFEERKQESIAGANVLRPRRDELLKHVENRDQYEADTITNNKELFDIQSEYETHVRMEDWVKYVLALMADTQVTVDSITLVSEDPVTTLQAYNPHSEHAPEDDPYGVFTETEVRRVTADLSCAFTYSQLKRMLDFLYRDGCKTSLVSVNVTYNSLTGGLRGGAIVDKFYLTSPNAPYEKTDLGVHVPIEVRNPFRSSP